MFKVNSKDTRTMSMTFKKTWIHPKKMYQMSNICHQ